MQRPFHGENSRFSDRSWTIHAVLDRLSHADETATTATAPAINPCDGLELCPA